MSFRTYAAIIFGMTLLGFSLGIVLGVYLQIRTGSHAWAYLAVPTMGAGSAIAAYGTLNAAKGHKDTGNNNGD
ncbi:MAG: hypothetical protein KAU50_05565 [Candidatus Marinimicrobia bacterium]|nr:hypothetical protein [Candidatus Neomarinimicrobiota bacterium]